MKHLNVVFVLHTIHHATDAMDHKTRVQMAQKLLMLCLKGTKDANAISFEKMLHILCRYLQYEEPVVCDKIRTTHTLTVKDVSKFFSHSRFP